MYEEFYGLSEKPFSLTPNPRFVFQSEQYRTAEEALLYGIGQKEGFMLVTGAPGTGKTTLCRDLLEKLNPEQYRVALLFNPFLNGVEMLQALLAEYGLGDAGTTSRKELLDRLNTYLLQQLANGRTCIAIFDEAQHLSTEFLEQIRVLSNLETEQEKLIQIILVGQPELLTLIRTPQMAQLDQRVSVRCTLTHLDREETGRYIAHRLNVAGSRGRVRFQDKAVRLLHSATGGVPRLINLTADRSMLSAFGEQQRAISDQHVRQAIASLRGEEGMDANAAAAPPKILESPRRPRAWFAAAGVAVVAIIAALWWQLDGMAEILAVRAAGASTTAAAESTYVRIAREHPQSRHRESAIIRLAQLQIARGAHREAQLWLDVLRRDYPRSAGAAEGQFWMARALFAGGDTTGACATARKVSAAAAGGLATDFATMNRECVAFEERAKADSSVSVNGADSSAVRPAGTPTPPEQR